MSDGEFVFIMAAILVLGIAVPAYVRYKDARDDDRRFREFMDRRRCLRWECRNEAVEGRGFCQECIDEIEGKGIKV